MGNDFGGAVDAILENANRRFKVDEGDFIQDEVVYCGKCKTPRESYVTWFDGSRKKVPIVCRCRAEQAKARKEADELLRLQDSIRDIKQMSLMDSKFAACSFDSLELNSHNHRNAKICKAYANRFPEMLKKNQGLLFTGPIGTGKTHMASCIGNFVMDRRYTVLCVSLAMLLEQARRSGEADNDIIRRICSVDLLIVDDLGTERGTEYATEFVYRVIDSRYRSNRPMIVTTNLPYKEMQECKDVRLSRIYERVIQNCIPLSFTGPSFRMKDAAKRYSDTLKLLEGEE